MDTIFTRPGPSSRPMAEAIAAFDWETTLLGPRQDWPVSLRTALDLMLSSRFAMCATWGPDQTFVYNDAYVPFLSARHPSALGKPIKDVWPEIWGDLEPMIDRFSPARPSRWRTSIW